MPFRAMLYTIVTVTLALLAVTLWISAVGPLLSHAPAATMPGGGLAAGAGASPERSLHLLFKGTMLLSFLLICLLLVVGFAATMREWMRPRPVVRAPQKTPYVDAWKLAGERMKTPEPPAPADEE